MAAKGGNQGTCSLWEGTIFFLGWASQGGVPLRSRRKEKVNGRGLASSGVAEGALVPQVPPWDLGSGAGGEVDTPRPAH